MAQIQNPPFYNPAIKLLALIANGLQTHAIKNTASQLGDRSSYVGMSDIGLMQECPRLAVHRKMNGLSTSPVTIQNYEQILNKQLTLQRGHWLEDGIANALYANGFHLIPQLEIAIEIEDVPIRAHLDFVLVGENVVRILELKSTANIPKSLSKSHEMQIQGQTALLKEYWNQPVFNLRDIHGNLLYEGMTFSEISEKYLGIKIAKQPDSIDVQGWLLCVSMKEAKAYGPFIPQDLVLKLCKKNAQELWDYMQKIDANIIPHAKGFCMLCSFCEYATDCPKFDVTTLTDWEETLEKLEKLKTLQEETKEEINILEENIKQSIFPTELKGKWIETGKYRFRVSEQKGRKSLDKNLLVAELNAFMGEKDVQQLLSDCEVENAPFARLYTKLC